MNITNNKTLCCSDICEKQNECARHCINNYGTCYVENYYSFGSGTMSENGCEIEHWCGEQGHWRMFEPIDKKPDGRGLRRTLLIIDDLVDIDKEELKETIKNAEQKVIDFCGCNLKT